MVSQLNNNMTCLLRITVSYTNLRNLSPVVKVTSIIIQGGRKSIAFVAGSGEKYLIFMFLKVRK